jgi:hypothetical protein
VANRGNNKNKEDVDAAKGLMLHTACMGGAFLVIILVAVGIDLFSKLLVKIQWIEPNNYIFWSLYVGSRALVGIDLVGLIGVVGKLTLRKIRTV